MKTLLFILMAALIPAGAVVAQPAANPWNTVNGGGGTSSASGYVLTSSVGQAGVTAMVGGVSLVDESGFIPGVRNLGGTTTTSVIPLVTAWNMVSVPLRTSNMSKSAIFPAAVSYAFAYQVPGGYVRKDTLSVGKGYWVKYPGVALQSISGSAPTNDTISVTAGWNLVGSLAFPMPTLGVVPVPPVTISSLFFDYTSGPGYRPKDTLRAGAGYWVKVSQAGSLVLGGVLASTQQNHQAPSAPVLAKEIASAVAANKPLPDGFAALLVTDESGRQSRLFFACTAEKINTEQFDLPPVPPGSEFDVRFTSQRFAEVVSADSRTEARFPITISGSSWPVTVNWEGNAGDSRARLEVTGGSKPVSVPLEKKGSVILAGADGERVTLVLDSKNVVQIPKEFALHQNYPNPFNPATVIRYDLPKDARVSLKVYNLIGQEVTTLVDRLEEAGYKSVTFNAADFPSGVYFYRLQTDGYTSVKKLMLLR